MSKEAVRATSDPITLEVINEGLLATMSEVRANVMRAAYSSVIALLNDFSCGLFDQRGQLIAQGPDHPGHVIPLPWGVQTSLARFEGDIHEGDVILLNDPYSGGTHLNDVTTLYPVFDDGELLAFAAVRAHWADVGGISPGSYAGEATNIFYEGLRIPPIKIYERGEPNRAALALIMNNVRLPGEREGDLLACVGACKIAERRLLELTGRYGRETVRAAVADNMDRSERRMRAQIRELRDGTYVAEDYVEFVRDGWLDPGLMSLRLTVAGDEIEADFTDSSPQLPGVANSTAAVSLAGVLIAVKAALDPGGAINAGTFRPITLKTKPGTIADVRFDAPANAHGEVRKRAVGVTLAALARVVPDLVSGDLCGSSYPNSIGGWDAHRSRPFVYTAFPAGGNGATIAGDGPNALGNVDMGSLPLYFPAEEQESIFPFVFEEAGLRPDSEGAGRTRGGLGARFRLRMRDQAERLEYSFTCDRAIIPPWGVSAGMSASPIVNRMVESGGTRGWRFQQGRVSSHQLEPGSALEFNSAGGGGYGDPLWRDPDLVASDVADGYVSAERAEEVYGVRIASSGQPDRESTAALRAEIRSRRITAMLSEDARESYVGRWGRHRVQRLSRELAGRLGVVEGDLIELRPQVGASLRAWVRLEPGAVGLPIDRHGLELLGLRAGDAVEITRPATINDANDLRQRADRLVDGGRW